MIIRDQYYIPSNHTIDRMLRWINRPRFIRLFLKKKRDLKIALVKFLGKDCVGDRWHRSIEDFEFFRTFPINLSKNEIIAALRQEYKDSVGIDISFQKDLAKSLSSKEKEAIIQSNKKSLKEENQYLLDLIEKLK